MQGFELTQMRWVGPWYRVSVLALQRFIDPLNRSFDPKKFDEHGIKGSIIALITIAHHIHVSKFVSHIFDPMVSDLSANPAPERESWIARHVYPTKMITYPCWGACNNTQGFDRTAMIKYILLKVFSLLFSVQLLDQI